MIRQVLLAPVPCVHLASAAITPHLSERVAFGSSKTALDQLPIGMPVFIYTSQPPHRLFQAGVASWTGTLGAIVPAVRSGARSGKHPNPSVRPPTAEAGDEASMYFWEVLGLHHIEAPRPLTAFLKPSGGKPFSGDWPQWPVLVEHDC